MTTTPGRSARTGPFPVRRRTFAAACLGVILTTAPLSPALGIQADGTVGSPGSATADSVGFDDVFRLEVLAPGVWAAVVKPDPDAYAFANSLVVVGDDGVLVVDTQQSPAAARALAAKIDVRTGRPVRWVVNTHWHGDHVYGNQVYRERHPGVRFIGHSTLVRDLPGIGARRLRELRERLPDRIEARRRALARGTRGDGSPLTEEQLRRLRRSLRLNVTYQSRLEDVRLIGPDTTFERRMELDLGGRRVVLHHFGPAHTAGDVIVHLPDEGIVAAGDLVEDGLPYLEDATVRGWAGVLDSLAALDADVVLPSHGSVRRDRRLLEVQRGLFRAVVEHGDLTASAVRSGPESPDPRDESREGGGENLLTALTPPQWRILGVDPSADRERIVTWLEEALDRLGSPRP